MEELIMNPRLLIGIITTECHTEYQGEIMRGILSQGFKSNCDLAVICSLNNFFIETPHKINEKAIYKLILSDVFDGFIYDRNSFKNESIKEYIDHLCTKAEKPVMLMDYNDHKHFETTMADDIDAFEKLTDHLIDVHGCKKIYCLTGIKGTLAAEERLRGYLRSMKKHHLSMDKTYYSYGDFWKTAPIDYAQKILSGRLDKPDAVVCANDIMAVTLADTLIKGGMRVPEDVAVIGFDASTEGYHFNPSITSCKRPNFQLGAEALRRLYRIITGKICSKVPDEVCEIRLGRSCGCSENPDLKRETKRQMRIVERFHSKMDCSDMMIDISNTKDVSSLVDRVDNYTYLIHKINHMYMCFTEKFLNAVNNGHKSRLDFNEYEPVNICYDKMAVFRNQPHGYCNSAGEAIKVFCRSRKQASAFYISPLHYNENFFGFTAISFGKHPITYNKLYHQWIGYVNLALEKVRMQSEMNATLKKLDSIAVYDNITGLLSKNGFEMVLNKKIEECSDLCGNITYIHIELTELKNFYYKNGYSKTCEAVKVITDNLKSCLKEDEICGAMNVGCYGIVSFEENRAEIIFEQLKKKLQNINNMGQGSSVCFTMGLSSSSISDKIDLQDMLYNAATNKIHTYSKQEVSVNPQFEKLCSLRNNMRKNPELSWSISEISDGMFISKSYLQKIYKSYFNISIIEELIKFRLEKAKKLLIESDKTVTDIARDCGYSTYNYFARQFRSAENVSPSQYREIHLNKNTEASQK